VVQPRGIGVACGFGMRRSKDITKMTVEILNVWFTAQSEFVLAEAQSPQQDTVIENLRTPKIGYCDKDVVDSNNFGHGMAMWVEGLKVRVNQSPNISVINRRTTLPPSPCPSGLGNGFMPRKSGAGWVRAVERVKPYQRRSNRRCAVLLRSVRVDCWVGRNDGKPSDTAKMCKAKAS
jgi:hypothetical protein